MKVERSTILDAPVEEVNLLVTKFSTLKYISSPLLMFSLDSMDEEITWRVGQIYEFKLRKFGFIPLGKHSIEIVKITQNRISSVESGIFGNKWRHDIFLEEVADEKTRYTDLVDINSGILTPFIWVFAKIFYKHRQRKWKLLLESVQNTN